MPSALTVLASILFVASFPPWGARYLIFFALIPWLLAVQRSTSARRATIQGLYFSMGIILIGFYWVAYVLHQFGELPWWLAGVCLVIFSTFGQSQFPIFAPLYFKLHQLRLRTRGAQRFLWGIAIALLYTGLDWLLPRLFRDTLGHSQYTAPWIRQSADIFGAHGLTFVIFWINDSLLMLYREIRSRKEPSIWPAVTLSAPSVACSLLALSLVALYGRSREQEIHDLINHPVRTAQAAVIQANIGDFDKVASEHGIRGASQVVMDKYFSLSDRAIAQLPTPDFIVWPETAYPSTFRTPMSADDLARDERVESFVQSRGYPLLFGGYDRKNGKDFNSFYLLSPPTLSLTAARASEWGQPADLQVYHKNILLLFGEYVPFTENSKLFEHYFPQVANFGRGVGPEVLQVPLHSGHSDHSGSDRQSEPLRLSPIICYEALFPDYVIEAANKGSQMIMNITNDSWFGPYGEPILHLSLTAFRSIETRLPQLRATNTGISTLIQADGEITSPTDTFVEQILAVQVPVTKPIPTLMKQWGDWFGKFALGAGLLLIAVLGWREITVSRSPQP